MSGNMIAVHQGALQAGVGVLHEFLLKYKSEKKCVYGILEGKDDSIYYKGLIQLYLPEEWDIDFIVAGNRDKVLAAAGKFDWKKYDRNRICFFIDRDLSEFVGVSPAPVSNIYITDKYSIENDAASFNTMKRLLEETQGLSGLSQVDSDSLRNAYDLNFSLFCEAMRPVMAQIILWRQQLGLKAILDKIEVKEFFLFTDGVLSIKNSYVNPAVRIAYAAQQVAAPISPEQDIDNMSAKLLEQGRHLKFIRGKYAMWFFIQCAIEFQASICSLTSLTSVPKPKVSLGFKNALALVAGRSRCPNSLRAFIDDNYIKYIMNADAPFDASKDSKSLSVSMWFSRLRVKINDLYSRLFG